MRASHIALFGNVAARTAAAAGGGAAAFPSAAASATSVTSASSSSHAVTLPADISSGDLLVIVIASASGGTTTFSASGWTTLHTKQKTTALGMSLAILTRTADGDEGASVTVTSSLANISAHNSWRVTNWQGTPEVGSVISSPDSDTADPPSLSPSYGADKTLWLEAASTRAPRDAPTHSTGYSGGITAASGAVASSSHVRVASAWKQAEAATEDPDGIIYDLSTSWIAATVAIQGV
jgi:hypothetical protein